MKPSYRRAHGAKRVQGNAAEKLWGKVIKHGTNGCWLFTGALDQGYGVIRQRVGKRSAGKIVSVRAHRVAYEVTNGPIPVGMVVRHLCHNRACCNPAHLVLGSHEENMADMTRSGRSLQGSRNPAAKLDEIDAANIRANKGVRTAAELGDLYGVHPVTIRRIWRGERWKKK